MITDRVKELEGLLRLAADTLDDVCPGSALEGKIRAALSQQAEPVEPAPAQDEREAFEAWCDCDLSRTTPDGPYRYSPASAYWRAWQARAALTAQGGE